MAKDYYEILGVDKNASDEEIRKAYRKKAVQYHPDKQGGDEEKFKEASEAYETLKDSQKRQQYDQFGHSAYQSAQKTGGAGRGPFQGYGGQQFDVDFGDIDLGDIFGSFFGGGGRSSRARSRTPRGRDVEARVSLSFKEAVFGTEKTIELNLEDTCEHCDGKMAEPGSDLKTCSTCGGQGQVVQTQNTILGAIQHASVCPDCHGKGKKPEKACSECGGKGTKRSKQNIKVKIPGGVDDGMTLRLRGRGEAVGGGEKGDLFVRVSVKKDKKFERHGRNILSSRSINMVDAALGTEVSVDTVDGKKKIKIPSGTQSGKVFRVSGSGVPYGDGKSRGDHLVKVDVEIPKRLSRKQKKILEELRKEL